jgi:small subunit ribosomal protein S2
MKITLEQMILVGIHLGHHTSRWNPKINIYIYGARKGIHLIDLVKTRQQLEKAQKFVTDVRLKGENILFVGTKKQAVDVVTKRAQTSQSFFVNERWLGGMLTNWTTIKTSLFQLHRLERKQKETKILEKNQSLLRKRLDRYLGGLKGIQTLPGVVIIVGQTVEITAIHECRKLGIPTICRLDTDCNPRLVSVGVPMNDDSLVSISLFLDVLLPGIQEGRRWWISKKAKKQGKLDSLSADKQMRVLKTKHFLKNL